MKEKKLPNAADFPSIKILDIPYFGGTLADALRISVAHARERRPLAVFTPGAVIAARAAREDGLLALLKRGDLILADGYGCRLAARLSGGTPPERIAGIDFAEALLGEVGTLPLRVFLYGGKAGVAERAAARLRVRYPELILAAENGFGDDPWRRISRFSPHIVCVCLGAERQEAWILKHIESIGGVMIGLGGSLDVWAGDVKRAPRLIQRVGLEWAYRTIREPRRLSRLFPLPAYFWKCLSSRRSSNCQKKE